MMIEPVFPRRRKGPLKSLLSAGVLSALMATALWAPPAQGQDMEAFLTEFSAVLGDIVTVRTVADLCGEREPEMAEQRRERVGAWENRNDLRVFDAILTGLSNRYEALSTQLANVDEVARKEILPQIEANPEECAQSDLENEDATRLRDRIRALARSAHDLDIRPLPGAIPDTVSVVPLAELSERVFEVMDTITPENTPKDDLEDAREAYLEYYLDAWGYVAGLGRIQPDGEVREWRGDYRSRFALNCRSFAEDAYESRMKEAAGRDMIVIGEPRYALVRQEGGTISLNNCHVFEPEGVDYAPEPDANMAGLEMRPLDISEAYAGPDAGPGLNEIDRVLYDARFASRLDGFGNGYVDRREDIYVLLRDGTAFRHDWSFPVTDLDTEALRRREPHKWFTWSDEGGTVVLASEGEGADIRLDDAKRLHPIGNGRVLDEEYYYLQVGMGGIRTDRSYVFSGDGEVVYSSGGLVAGNFATSYIIVAGGEKDERRSAYWFEDYALVTETPEGEERRFFAILEGEDASSPAEVIIGGAVYWLKDRDEPEPDPRADGK